MIGIVVVSHSRPLAQAAVDLAAEMVQDGSGVGLVVEVAAGLDTETFGTDAVAVAEAIGRADAGDGVLVLLDLGSAVLSAEMALELLEPDLAGRVRLSDAPLVEGLVAAAVTAATGADLDTVAAEAGRGLSAKTQHLAPSEHPAGAETTRSAGGTPGEATQGPGSTTAEAVTSQLRLTGEHGLHARPAAAFVRCVARFPGSRVQVRNLDSGRGPVDGRSLTAIATLDARQGHRLDISATGAQAEQVVQALTDLADDSFGAGTGPVGAPASRARSGGSREPLPPTAMGGSGLEAAVGPVVRRGMPVDLSGYAAGDADHERERLQQAFDRARSELSDLVERTREQVGEAEAAIFEAHLGLLDDPALTEPVRAAVAGGIPAPQAWQERVGAVREEFEALSDDHQRERAQDIGSVGERVLRALAGEHGAAQQWESAAQPRGTIAGPVSRPAVLVVDELDPATALTLDPAQIAGVVTIRGGATGHGVLVARARGVPVLTGAGPRADVPEGSVLAFDARTGRLEVDPDPEVLATFEQLLAERAEHRRRAEANAHEPARTTDGHIVAVKANLSGVLEAAPAAAAGADGSGLVRTEVLFAGRDDAPAVQEQVEAFTAIAEAMGGRAITIRTWDVGGDKPLRFHPQPEEANPFLGVRGLRSFRADPRLLVDQLEAVCRVAQRHPLRVMFPMVSTVEEVDWALARLDEAAGRLSGGRPDDLGVGIMVEVPAAALRPEALSTLLDFVSIGTNDLTQYALAADRGNPGMAGLADHADPAVLRLVQLVCDGVPEGVEVCACGDAASDPGLAALLVGLGVRELSATTATVPLVKARLREHSLADLQDLALRALHCDSAAEVRTLLDSLGAGA